MSQSKVEMGSVVIEVKTELTLAEMLLAFDPQKHGGEVMAGDAIGVEILVNDETESPAQDKWS